MAALRRMWIQVQSYLLSLFRRSLKSHGTLRISNPTQSLAFYRKLGFQQVTSSRGNEVILLRNHRGDEMNIVADTRRLGAAGEPTVGVVTFRVENLNQDLEQLQTWHSEFEIIDDAMSRRLQIIDPDGNVIEFYEQFDRDAVSSPRIYHVATQSEFIAGLSEHYYLPPERENRFVRAKARSALLTLVCNRVAEEANAIPLIIEMDEGELSVEAQLVDDSDFDSTGPDALSAYPHVNSPISRQAITAVGICDEKEGDYSWPARFTTADAIPASIR